MFSMGGVASVPNNPSGFCGRKATLNERRGGDRAASEVFNLRMVLINNCQTSLLVLLRKLKAVCMQVALVGELGISCVTARSSGPGVNTFAISPTIPELRTCVKVEVAVLGSPSLMIRPYGLCGRKATVN